MRSAIIRPLVGALGGLALAASAGAQIVDVAAGESIQAAIAAADPDSVVRVAAGTFDEDLDFLGKALTVVGAGPDTIVRGTGNGPVVTFAGGEGSDSVLDSLTITGGRADRGAGVYVLASAPILVRLVIRENVATQKGSGVYAGDGAAPWLYNNLLVYNSHEGPADPHTVQVEDASALLVNNTIARNDSNGVFVTSNSSAVLVSLEFEYNF